MVNHKKFINNKRKDINNIEIDRIYQAKITNMYQKWIDVTTELMLFWCANLLPYP